MPYLRVPHRIRCCPHGLHDAARQRAGDGGTNDYHHYHRGHLSTRRWPSRRPPGVFSLLPRTKRNPALAARVCFCFVRRSSCYRDPDPRFDSLGGHPVALRPLRVGMIGIGTVGAGTFRVLARNQALIAARAGRGIEGGGGGSAQPRACRRHRW